MSFHTVADYKNRPRLLRWLHEKTTIKMESGADVWPFEELEKVRGDVVVRASKTGIAVIIPLAPYGPASAPRGRQVGIREFCEKIRQKFPIMEQTEPGHQEAHQAQGEIPGITGRPTP